MKQKRKVKSLLSSKQLFDKGEFKVLLVAGGCTLFLCALSLFTLSVGVALGDNNGAHLSYSGVNDRIEVLYHLGFTNADTLLDKDYMVMSGKSLYVSPRSVVVNEVASCPGWGYSSEWCFSDDNEVSAGNYGNILGGNYNKVSSNNVTIIAGNNNTVRAGNDNVTVLGGKSNIVDSNIFGTPSVMVGGNGNLLGSGSSNAVVGGTGNSITGGAIGSSVLGGSGNKIQGYKGDVIVGGENVVVDGGVNNVFAYSSKSSEFKPESSNAFYLDTNNGLGINVASVDGVTTSGAVSFGEIDINISCNSTIIGLQGSRNGCLVGCTSTSASRDSKRELLDRGSECGKKCRENNRCLAGNEDDSNKPDYPAFCTDNVNINNAHLCSNEKDSYKNVIFETYLVDNGGCPSGIKNKCVFECDEHAKLLTDHTGKHNVDGNPETACFKSCRDPINGKWILHNGRARLYENDEYMCADQCGDHMGDVVCNDGKWYDIGSDGKAAEETQKHESCTTMPSSCSADFKLTACPFNGNCSSCAPYTVNNNSCVKGVTGYQLNSCNDVNNCSAITYRVSDDIRTQHSEDSEYGSCDLYEPNSDRTNCGPNTIYQLIGCKGANHTEQGTPSWMQYCIPNTKNVQCLQQGYKPTGSHYVLTGVEITWQGYGETPWKDGSWSTVANCEWDCDEQTHEDGGSCASNMKQVACDNTKSIPEHSHYREPLEQVRVTWYDESGTWSEPTVCPWDCDAPDYEKSQDGSSCVPVASTQSEDCGGTKPEGEGYVLGHSTFQQTCNSLGVCTPTIEDDNGKWKWHHVDAGPGRPAACEYTCNGSKDYVLGEDGVTCVKISSEPEPDPEVGTDPEPDPTNGCTGPEPDFATFVEGSDQNLGGETYERKAYPKSQIYDTTGKYAGTIKCAYDCNPGYVAYDGKCYPCENSTQSETNPDYCVINVECGPGYKWDNVAFECKRLGNCKLSDGTIYNGKLPSSNVNQTWDNVVPIGINDQYWKCYDLRDNHTVKNNYCEYSCKQGYYCYRGVPQGLSVLDYYDRMVCDTPSCYDGYNSQKMHEGSNYIKISSTPDKLIDVVNEFGWIHREFVDKDTELEFRDYANSNVGCWYWCPKENRYTTPSGDTYCYTKDEVDDKEEDNGTCVDEFHFGYKYEHKGSPVEKNTAWHEYSSQSEAEKNNCAWACIDGSTKYKGGYPNKKDNISGTWRDDEGTYYCYKKCGADEYITASGCEKCPAGTILDTSNYKVLGGIKFYLGCIEKTCPDGTGMGSDGKTCIANVSEANCKGVWVDGIGCVMSCIDPGKHLNENGECVE